MLKAVRTMLIVLLNIVFYGLVVFGGVQLCRPDRQKHLPYRRMMVNLK